MTCLSVRIIFIRYRVLLRGNLALVAAIVSDSSIILHLMSSFIHAIIRDIPLKRKKAPAPPQPHHQRCPSVP
jgi:hypothetical protein